MNISNALLAVLIATTAQAEVRIWVDAAAPITNKRNFSLATTQV